MNGEFSPGAVRRSAAWGALAVSATLCLATLGPTAMATDSSDGRAGSAVKNSSTGEQPDARVGRVALVEVDTSTAAEQRRLSGLSLDGGVGGTSGERTSVVVIGDSDRAKLRRAGLDWTVKVADLEQRNRAARAQEQARAAQLPGPAKDLPDAGARPELVPPQEVMPRQVQRRALPPQALSPGKALPKAASSMPSGRVSYRTILEINNELRYLAQQYPDTVKLFRLPNRSLLGSPIYGIEITHDVDTDAGKPVFLSTGVTHAREWPTAEYTMEFAWHLLLNDGSSPRVTGLLEQTRVILVPVVNVDGFNISRSLTQEYKRKNCRMEPGERPGPNECANPANSDLGVDLNRNQGAYWGDIGASPDPTSGTYRGEGPFSEPEIKNMRHLLTRNSVSIYNANHTFGAYVLRGPSNPNEPTPPDEDQWAALAQAMAAENGYTSGPPFELLYPTSGTSEETGWTATSTFSFEFEHGTEGFHPPYEIVASEWAENRNAYLVALEAAANPSTHAVLNADAPEGAELQLRKRFTMYTAPVLQPDGSHENILPVPMNVRFSTTVPVGGDVQWHVQPSLRPSQARTGYIEETYTLTCARPDGTVLQREAVQLARGEQVDVDLSTCTERWDS